MSAYGQGAKYVDDKNIKAAIKDTEDAQLQQYRKKPIAKIIVSILVIASLATYFLLR